MFRTLLTAGAVALGLLAPAAGRAAYVLEFAGPATVPVGGSIDVSLFLVETAPDTLLAVNGLAGAELTVAPTAGSGVAVTAIAPNPDFASAVVDVAGGLLRVSQELDPGLPLDGDRVLLGTFTFAGQSVGETTFTATPLPGGFFAGDPDVTDVTPPAAAFTVTAVPEPGSLALCGLAAVAGVRRLSRRKA